MKRIFNYFFQGLLFVIPAAVSIYVIYYIFTSIDNLFKQFLPWEIPGIGFLLTIFGIIFIGFLTSNIFTRKFFNIFDSIFSRFPIVKLIYSSIKDLMEAFVGEKKRFDKPALVQLSPDSDVKILGFITRESLNILGIENHCAVYIPQSYNFAGNLIILPSERVKPLKHDSTEVLTFIVSGGVSLREKKKPLPLLKKRKNEEQ